MGATGTHYSKAEHRNLRSFFEQEFNGANEHGTWTILDFAALNRGRVCYAAMRRTYTDGRPAVVYGLVVLCHFTPRDHYNITYRDMGDSEGPNESECPERILKLLDPPANEYAANWRQRCADNLAKRKAKRGLFKVGDAVEFAKSLSFKTGGCTAKIRAFRVLFTKPLTFHSDYVGRCRIRRATLLCAAFTVMRDGVMVFTQGA